MFRKSHTSHQLDLFYSPNNLLQGKSLNNYKDNNSWHNQFRLKITNKIDENIFKPLYNNTIGSPNSPIRILMAMMILKEARGMSDAEIFENSRYNMLTRSALGLMNIEDKVPTESTYYLFRKNVLEYAEKHGDNLFDKVFETITKHQCAEFEVSGKRIRMDSKLLGSNIAWMSRYELIHKTLELFYKDVKGSEKIDKDTANILSEMLRTEGEKVVYTQSSDEVKKRLEQLGVIIYKLLFLFDTNISSYHTLRLVFYQQYNVDDKNNSVSGKSNQEISAQSVQSPYDTDCEYRNKDGNKKKGYSINITETCEESNSVNLITNVNVAPASTSDNDFFQSDIEATEKVVQKKVSVVHTDGAYHSQDNQSYCEKNDITLHLNAIQGAKGRYKLKENEKEELIIHDRKTGLNIDYVIVKSRQGETKWRIVTEKGYRYFTIKDLKNSLLREKIEETPLEVLQKRNNVEASIFQLGYHYPHDKSRYRGEIKHQMWANVRCLWVNYVRILKYLQKTPSLISNIAQNVISTIYIVLIDKICRNFRTFFKQKSLQSLTVQLASL